MLGPQAPPAGLPGGVGNKKEPRTPAPPRRPGCRQAGLVRQEKGTEEQTCETTSAAPPILPPGTRHGAQPAQGSSPLVLQPSPRFTDDKTRASQAAALGSSLGSGAFILGDHELLGEGGFY